MAREPAGSVEADAGKDERRTVREGVSVHPDSDAVAHVSRSWRAWRSSNTVTVS